MEVEIKREIESERERERMIVGKPIITFISSHAARQV